MMNDLMRMRRRFHILIVIGIVLTSCYSQNLNYQCDFDTDMTGDCQFKPLVGTVTVTASPGVIPINKPTQPLSDVGAVLKSTIPNNEFCKLPYAFTPGNWDMYFCRRYNDNNYTCPTESGVGKCFAGKYVFAKAPLFGSLFNQTYYAEVKRSGNPIQCIDFYYYITDTSNNARMKVGWKSDADIQPIVEVTALAENKWQHSQTTFSALPSSPYQITFNMMRNGSSASFYFALDEIKIYDQPCDSAPITTSTLTTSIIEVSTTTTTTETTTTTIETTVIISETSTTTTTESTTTTAETIVIITETSTTTTTESTTTITESTTTTTETTTTTAETIVIISETSTTTTTESTTTTTETTTTTTETTTTTTTTETTSSTTSQHSTSSTTTTQTQSPVISILSSTTTTSAIISTTSTTQSTTTTVSTTRTTTTTTITTTTSSSTTSTTTTTMEPIILVFTCDFSKDSCFSGNEILVTNGSEFASLNVNEPPRAPFSDVNSINEPTENDEKCELPYQLSIDNITNGTDWDMWFCYNNQCPTKNEKLSTCKSGNYGLIPIESWESNKTITHSISSSTNIRSSNGDRCLHYYTYLTVYEKLDWSQRLVVFIEFDNETDASRKEIDRFSSIDMSENRWHQRNITFVSNVDNYTLIFEFEIPDNNQTDDIRMNKTIYFALDNINIYNQNCDDVFFETTTTTTTTSTMTQSSTTDVEVTAEPTSKPNNLGLILGLSLGIGIPVLIFIILMGFYLKRQKGRRGHFNLEKPNKNNIPLRRRIGRSSTGSVA